MTAFVAQVAEGSQHDAGVDPSWWTLNPYGREESPMGKTRPPYPPEFRRRMVELVRSGRSPEQLAQEFEPTAQSIRSWVY